MSQLKNRLQALSLLDRAFAALTDAEMEALVASLPDDHREAVDQICGAKEGGFDDPAARTLAMRATASRGRMTGQLEQLSTVVTDPCLAKCIDMLGDNSDNPTEPQLLEVTPTLIEEFGIGATRLMLASSVAGMDHMVRRMRRDTSASLPDVIRMASLTPAERAGIAAEAGSLETGKQADIVVLSRRLAVSRVFIGGIEAGATARRATAPA